MTGLMKVLAKHMRERRKSLGFTQEQLAEKSGLSPNYIAKLEVQKRIPSVAALVALSEALEVEVADLLSKGTGETRADAVNEMVHLMSGLDTEDCEFALESLRLLVSHIGRLRAAKGRN